MPTAVSMETFAAWLRSLGLRPGAVEADGRWHACGTDDKPRSDAGRYRLAPGGAVGWAMDWRTMSRPEQWRAGGAAADFDWEAHHREVARLKAEDERRRRDAVRAAAEFWDGCRPLRGGHPYLAAKGLDMDGCSGLRVDAAGWLVAPARVGGRLVGLQRISPEGVKRQWPGAPMRGSSCRIERRSATMTAVVEGLATGLAVYQAVGRATVIVGWCAGMMAAVGKLPPGFRVVCADNDAETAQRLGGRNPGVEAGEAAAKVLGAGVVWPTGIRGTDWADWRTERREAELARHRSAGAAYRVVDEAMARLITAAAVWVPASR